MRQSFDLVSIPFDDRKVVKDYAPVARWGKMNITARKVISNLVNRQRKVVCWPLPRRVDDADAAFASTWVAIHVAAGCDAHQVAAEAANEVARGNLLRFHDRRPELALMLVVQPEAKQLDETAAIEAGAAQLRDKIALAERLTT